MHQLREEILLGDAFSGGVTEDADVNGRGASPFKGKHPREAVDNDGLLCAHSDGKTARGSCRMPSSSPSGGGTSVGAKDSVRAKDVEPCQVGEQREVGRGVLCPMPAVDFDDAIGEFEGRRDKRRKVRFLKNNPRGGVGERINCVEARHIMDHYQVDVGEESDDVQWRVGKRNGVCLECQGGFPAVSGDQGERLGRAHAFDEEKDICEVHRLKEDSHCCGMCCVALKSSDPTH